jgi:hypothetical protein
MIPNYRPRRIYGLLGTQQHAPESVISYLVKTWMVDKELWSGVFRQDRTIFELGDTNMLVEA